MLTFLENFIAVCLLWKSNRHDISAARNLHSSNLPIFFAEHWIWGARRIWFSIGWHMLDNCSFQKTTLMFGLPLPWPKTSSKHRPLWLLCLEWEGKRTSSHSNVSWYAASDLTCLKRLSSVDIVFKIPSASWTDQVNWHENSGLHSWERTYPTCGKGNSSSQLPLEKNIEEYIDMSESKTSNDLASPDFPMLQFLNSPKRERVCFSAYWESPHWMATSRSSGERVVPRGFGCAMGGLTQNKRITVEVQPS